jgi:hypothetical protein
MTVADHYRYIKDDVISAAEYYGRNLEEITLVAVSKGCSWDDVRAAYQAGCRDFGESRVQEALTKILEAPEDIFWHFVGHLQKNKVSKVLGKCALIHSVDTFELASKISELSARTAIETSILLEVNISGEATKQGMQKEQWKRCFEAILSLPSIHVKGLMTMAPLTQDEGVVRRCFAGLREFRDELIVKNGLHADALRHLSMGMSNDYRLAIAEGATLLRVGTAIFSK